MDLEKLTVELAKNGRLGSAVVVDAQLTTLETNGLASELFRVELKYSNRDHLLPGRMVVKRPNLTDRGRGEAAVYEQILGHSHGLPTMTFYGIVDDDPDLGLNFLFEDLSGSHHQTPWPIIPGLMDCEGAVTALARIHANWWGRTDSIPKIIPPVAPQQNPHHLFEYFPKFADFVGEYLSPRRIAEYERVFARLDALLNRRLTQENSTLLHTDSHFWNFLYANEGRSEDCVIFDWTLWNRGLGGSDLAYMIGLHLYPEHRRRFEGHLLDRYWSVLTENGVDYDRKDVQLDYRIGIIIGLLMPVMEFSWNIIPYDWIPKMEKAFAAFEDLNCSELLEAV